jgi:hypothetical protein
MRYALDPLAERIAKHPEGNVRQLLRFGRLAGASESVARAFRERR